jgi:hypothetical protein
VDTPLRVGQEGGFDLIGGTVRTALYTFGDYDITCGCLDAYNFAW